MTTRNVRVTNSKICEISHENTSGIHYFTWVSSFSSFTWVFERKVVFSSRLFATSIGNKNKLFREKKHKLFRGKETQTFSCFYVRNRYQVLMNIFQFYFDIYLCTQNINFFNSFRCFRVTLLQNFVEHFYLHTDILCTSQSP